MTTGLLLARNALHAIHEARDILERVRDVRIRVTGAWQQMDDLPAGAEEDLKRHLAEAVTSWARSQGLPTRPAWQVKVESSRPMDSNGLELILPVIWQEEADPHA